MATSGAKDAADQGQAAEAATAAPTTKAATKAKPKAATTRKAAKPKAAPKIKAGADDRARQNRGQVRKDQIIATALEMFATRGFRGTSVADLADAVGMTHPGLLYYFGTKERLLHEVVEARQSREREGYLGEMDRPSIFRLEEVARFVIDTAVFTRLYVVLASENLDPGDPLHEFFVKRYDRARRLVHLVLAADQARGEVRTDIDVEQIGIEVVSMLMGLEIQWLMDPTAIDLEAVIEHYLDGLRFRLAP